MPDPATSLVGDTVARAMQRAGRLPARMPFGDLLMDLLMALAGAQWMPFPVRCAGANCKRDVQAVRQIGPAKFLCLSCSDRAKQRLLTTTAAAGSSATADKAPRNG